ncbi:MAG TPA: GMC family oxidoreductase [Vicinamibacterales bacterium]|nr:GMC family oxidoreductase [Vicinamibacterales bacterium]
MNAEVLVVGSGAGGVVTAHALAHAGVDVLLLEEGPRGPAGEYARWSPDAMERFYRRRGMTPIVGRVPIGFVEGRCLGGSTEINSGFWHRTPPEVILRWQSQYALADTTPESLEPHFAWAEDLLGVALHTGPLPRSSSILADGAERMHWSVQEVPRMSRRCRDLLPAVEAAGARVVTDARVRLLLREGSRVTGVLAEIQRPDRTRALVRINADDVFVCGGATETPALLRRSGIRYRVGDSLRVHPMLKVAARFPFPLESLQSVLPLMQVKEFWPEITIGGAYFSLGHLAIVLSENWPSTADRMTDVDNMACFYVAVKGSGTGRVRGSAFDDTPAVRYDLSAEDVWNLSRGFSRLCMLLLRAGATALYPALFGIPAIRTELDAVRWLDERLPKQALALTTVHAFSSCPIGERDDRCAADSYGRVRQVDNLYINDASMLPDSPGVNPQGSIMALARRNALHFLDRHK